MADLRGVMSGIVTKAIEWEIIEESGANGINSMPAAEIRVVDCQSSTVFESSDSMFDLVRTLKA